MINQKYRVFGYVRVSTDNQIGNYSIDEQIERLTAYCTAKGWALVKIYTDGGYSGGNMNRPALNQMLEDLTGTEIDAVLVYKLDRLSRSQKDTLLLIEDKFLKNNVDFISINESFDTSTPFGRAMIGILSVFAQLEKDQITERFTMGRVGRCKAGYYHGGGNAPYGYRYIDGELIINEYEADRINEVYDLFLNGKSINSIGKTMSEKYKDRNWHSNTVGMTLKKGVYVGQVKFNGISYGGKHEPIISLDKYRAVQKLLKERDLDIPTAQKTPFRAGYLLSSLIYCARCNARYSANHGYYRCYSRAKSSKKFVLDPNCKNDHWPIDELDNLVIRSIQKLIDDNSLITEMATKDKPPLEVINTQKINAQILTINKQLGNLIDLYQIGNIPMDILNSKIQALDNEKKSLQSKLQPKNEASNNLTSFLETLKIFEDSFEFADMDTRRLLVASIVERITIDGQNVSIKLRI